MDLQRFSLIFILVVLIASSISAQYAYFPNDLELLAQLKVKQERIRYSEKLGDTSIFETNLYDERSNLIQYKSKERMPIQAKIISHYDENDFCYRVDYYRNHILYQYKEIKKTGSKHIERFYSVTGKYKGLQQTTFFNEKGQEEKLIVKRKGHPKFTRKYFYHDNGKLRQIWAKKDGKPVITNFDIAGEPLDGNKNSVIPRKILTKYNGVRVKIDMRIYKVHDMLIIEIVKVGKGYQKE